MAAFDRIMSEYGIPEEIDSDLEKFARYMGYQHNRKIPYAP